MDTEKPYEYDNVIIKSVSLYSEQWDIVEAVNRRYDFRSMSHALRFIVKEYDRLMADQQPEQ